MLDMILEKAVEAGVKYAAKQVIFAASDILLPGSGEVLRAADKAIRAGSALTSGMPEFDEALDNAGGFIDNLIY